MADLDSVEPRPVVDVVAVVRVNRLLDGAHVDAGEAPESGGEMAVGARIIGGPTGTPLGPIVFAEAAVAAAVAPAMYAGHWRVHQPGEGPLGFFLVIRGKREVLIFPARV